MTTAKRRGPKTKHPAKVFQVMWWAISVREYWREGERRLAEEIGKRRPRWTPRQKFLYDARRKGIEPRPQKGKRTFLDYVDVIAALTDGKTRVAAHESVFFLGDDEAFRLGGITRKLEDLLSERRLLRLSPSETRRCRAIREQWLKNVWRMPDIPLEEQARTWSVASIVRAQSFMRPPDWITVVVLSFREALLCGDLDLASDIRSYAREDVMRQANKIFAKATASSQREALKRFKASFFDTRFLVHEETMLDRIQRRQSVPRALLPNVEARLRRAALAARKRGMYCAFVLMKQNQQLWIYDELDLSPPCDDHSHPAGEATLTRRVQLSDLLFSRVMAAVHGGTSESTQSVPSDPEGVVGGGANR
jgi:hypothetical protein